MSEMRWVVMGVSGAGKSSVAAALAAATGGTMVEADDLHPRCNVEKMRSGVPLEDSDRWAWLDAVAEATAASPSPVFVACSALSRAHRERLRNVRFIHLSAPQRAIAARMEKRKGHFMPPTLLDSQFMALEVPKKDEAFLVDADATLDIVVERALKVVREHL